MNSIPKATEKVKPKTPPKWLCDFYRFLLSRADRRGWVNGVSLDEIGQGLGVSRFQVIHYLKRLARMKLKPILVVQRRGSHACNSYKVRFISAFLPSCDSPHTPLYIKEDKKDTINALQAKVGGIKRVKEELTRGGEAWRRRAMKVIRQYFTLKDGVKWKDFWIRKGIDIIKLLGWLVWKLKISLRRANELLANGCIGLEAVLAKAARIAKRAKSPKAVLIWALKGGDWSAGGGAHSQNPKRDVA